MKKTLITIIVLILVTFACGIAFYLYSQPPKETLSDEFKQDAVTKLLGRKAQLNAKDEPIGNTTYKGKYITFDYPAKALIYEYKDPSFASNSSVLDSFSFDIKQPRLVLNLQVLKNSGHMTSISDYPATRLRRDRAYEYKEAKVKVGGLDALRFTKSGIESEDTILLLANNKIISIAVTGSDPEEVKKLGELVLKTAKLY